MRSKSRSTFSVVNARNPRQSASAHAIYPQNAGLKLLTHRREDCRPPRVCTVRPGKLRDGRAKSIVPSSSGVTSADEIAMSEENDGVLGNLPRSRPGVRSDKRANSKQAPRAKPSTKARTKAAAKPRTAPRKPPAEQPPPPPATPSAATPIEAALKAGETVALTGIKVAGRVAGEVLRRLPRP